MVTPVSQTGLRTELQGASRLSHQEVDRQQHRQVAEARTDDRVAMTEATVLDQNDVMREVDRLNDVLQAADQNLRFKFHQEAETMFVELVDRKTDEVVKSFPPEYMLELAVKMKELIGVFVDKKL